LEIDYSQKHEKQEITQFHQRQPARQATVTDGNGEKIQDVHIKGDENKGIYMVVETMVIPGPAQGAHAALSGQLVNAACVARGTESSYDPRGGRTYGSRYQEYYNGQMERIKDHGISLIIIIWTSFLSYYPSKSLGNQLVKKFSY
jgi:hypothetical protein